MELGKSQYLRFSDAAGNVLDRWQNYYHDQAVSWQGASWTFVRFRAGGLTAGVSGDEASIVIEAPAILRVRRAFEAALRNGHLIQLSQYQFDPLAATQPPSGQVLQAQFLGQAVGGGASLVTMRLQLGSALAPIGRQVPPRSLTTLIMGAGARL